MEGGRDAVLAGRSGVTRMAVAGSRSSETEGDLVDGRGGTEHTVVLLGGVKRMAVAGPRSSETDVISLQ